MFRVIYDDELRFVGEEIADRTEVDTLPSNELLEAAIVPTVLASLLPKPSGTVSAKRGARMRCVECDLHQHPVCRKEAVKDVASAVC